MMLKKIVAISPYNGCFFVLPDEMRQLIYKTLNVRPIKSVKPFGFLDSYTKMFEDVEYKLNPRSDFMSSFIFFLKDIR